MQYYRCKCGTIETWSNDVPIYDCQGCTTCNTTIALTPLDHKVLIPHDFNKIRYNENTGKPYTVCTICGLNNEQSYNESNISNV